MLMLPLCNISSICTLSLDILLAETHIHKCAFLRSELSITRSPTLIFYIWMCCGLSVLLCCSQRHFVLTPLLFILTLFPSARSASTSTMRQMRRVAPAVALQQGEEPRNTRNADETEQHLFYS